MVGWVACFDYGCRGGLFWIVDLILVREFM